jgi:hypothetical protein
MYYIYPTDFIKKYHLFIEDDTRINLKLFLQNYGNKFTFEINPNSIYESFKYCFKTIDYQKKSFYTKLPRWFIYHTSEFTLKTIMVDDSIPYEKSFNQIYHMYITAFIKSYPNNKSIKREYKKFQKEFPEYSL